MSFISDEKIFDEIPVKKKAAVGVRGMKLSAKDEIRAVYYLNEPDMTVVETSAGELALNSLKIGKRDSKGSRKGK